jgi:hypothetical protein
MAKSSLPRAQLLLHLSNCPGARRLVFLLQNRVSDYLSFFYGWHWYEYRKVNRILNQYLLNAIWNDGFFFTNNFRVAYH